MRTALIPGDHVNTLLTAVCRGVHQYLVMEPCLILLIHTQAHSTDRVHRGEGFSVVCNFFASYSAALPIQQNVLQCHLRVAARYSMEWICLNLCGSPLVLDTQIVFLFLVLGMLLLQLPCMVLGRLWKGLPPFPVLYPAVLVCSSQNTLDSHPALLRGRGKSQNLELTWKMPSPADWKGVNVGSQNRGPSPDTAIVVGNVLLVEVLLWQLAGWF